MPTSSSVLLEQDGVESRQSSAARWAAFAVLSWMCLPLFTGRIYVCDDLLNYHLPIRQFYANCLASGDAFDWIPSLFSGFYLTGSGQAGTYHPLHWMLYRWLPLETAFNIEIISSYPFMLLGMKLFLQRHLGRSDAAWLGAIVFAFSGFCTLRFLHPNAVAVVSHIPWLLLVHDVILRPDGVRPQWHGLKEFVWRAGDVNPLIRRVFLAPIRGLTSPARLDSTTLRVRANGAGRRSQVAAEAGVVLLTASQILLGYPQYVWFSLLAEIAICLGFVKANWVGVRTLLLIAGLKVLGLCLGAVQLLPSMDALSESDRTAMPSEFFFQHPLTAPDMLQWIGPFLTKTRVFGVNTHDLGTYCGALPFLLAIVAVCRAKSIRQGSRLVKVMMALGLIALWLSFGKSGGLYVVQTWMPMIGKFRSPSRVVVVMHLVIAVLAAFGYAYLANVSDAKSGKIRLPRVIALAPWLSLAAAVGVFFLYQPKLVAPWTLLVIGPVLFFLAALMLKDMAKGKVSAGLMLFIAGDLAAYGFTYEALNNTRTMSEVMANLDQPPGSPADGRIVAETQISEVNVGFDGNDYLLAGWQQADGYEGLLPQLPLLDDKISLDGLRVSGVKWTINKGRHGTIPGLMPTSNPLWMEVPNPLPRFRLANRVVNVSSVDEAAKVMSADGPVVVIGNVSLKLNDSEPRGTIRPTSDRPGQIQMAVECNSQQLLVVAERFSKGWNATIDGQPASIVRADVDFMSCVVPPGNHTVRFSFEPASLKTGRMVSLAALFLLCIGIVIRWRPSSGKPDAVNPEPEALADSNSEAH